MLRYHDVMGWDPWDFLIRNGYINERELRQAQAQELGYGFVDLDRLRLDPALIASVSREMLIEYACLPLKEANGTLWVAMEQPSQKAVAALKAATHLRVVPVLTTPGAVCRALDQL